jgi:cell division septation protein DedD
MTNDRPHTMDEKQKRDASLHLADFKIDDMSSVPGERLLAEVAEEFGDPAHLAAAFDAIAFPVIANQGGGAVNEGAAAFSAARTTPGPASAALQASPSPSRAPRLSLRPAALATLAAEWLAVPVRRRVVLGALATLLLVAVLTPGIYPRLLDRSAQRPLAASKYDSVTPLPAPASSPPAPEMHPAAPGAADQGAAVPRAPVPAPASSSVASGNAAPPPTEERQAPPAPRAAAAPAPVPQPMAAARGVLPAAPSAPGQASVQRQAAKSVLPEGSGFVVQLSASKTEAEAQSILQALKSKYAALEGREPTIRRKDQGKRGVFYAVQVGPFETQQAAEQLCARVKAAGGSCFATKN